MSVQVKWDRPDQRRHLAVNAPLFVDVDGRRLTAVDWNLDAFTIPEFSGTPPEVGATADLRLTLPFQGFDVGFVVGTRVGDVAPATSTAGVSRVRYDIVTIGARERDLMSHFVQELLRGSMVPVEDTIQRIDVPVLPVKTVPDAPSADTKPILPRPLRAAGMTALYAAVGLVTFGYLGSLLFKTVFRLEVPTAVVTAPIETVAAQGEGYVTLTGFKVGDAVKEGDIVVRLFDNALERDIEQAGITINEKDARLAYLVQRQDNDEQRQAGQSQIDRKNVAQTKIAIESLQAQIRLAEQELRSIPSAITPGVSRSGPAAQADARRKILSLKKQLESRELDLGVRPPTRAASTRVGGGRTFGIDGDDIGAQVALAAQEVELAKQRHDSLLRHRDRLSARAPFDGVIIELPHVDKGSVRKGDVVAVIEQKAPRQVTAFLNQDEVARVRLGDNAQVHIEALGANLIGRISAIDRTSGFIKEQDRQVGPGVRWRGNGDRSARVTIAIPEGYGLDGLELMRSGLPAVVVFDKRNRDHLMAAVARRSAESNASRPQQRALQTTVGPSKGEASTTP